MSNISLQKKKQDINTFNHENEYINKNIADIHIIKDTKRKRPDIRYLY